jgi:DNA sulfur modification protein DndB
MTMPIGEISGVLKRNVGTQVYYFGTVFSDKIKGITFVPTVEPSNKTYLQEISENGYQRPGSRIRMRQFMRYLKENPNSLVPPVILSGRDGWKFEINSTDDKYGKIIIDQPAAIIDGQHRIGGYIALFEDDEIIRSIDFILLEGLNRDLEVSEFMVVNSTQQGVPKPLYAYLDAEEPARIAWALNEEEGSPFKGRITRTRMSKQHLFALHTVAKQVERTFNHGKFTEITEDVKLDYMIRYWSIIADTLQDEWSDIEKLENENFSGRKDFSSKLLEATGLIAWSLMGPEILGRSYMAGVGMNWEHVRKLVKACGNINWSKTGIYAGRTGEAGGPVLKNDMQRLLPPDEAVLLETEPDL